MKEYMGVADVDGIVFLSRKPSKEDNDLAAEYFEIANSRETGCYFEIELSDSQVDIIRDLGKVGDSKAGFAACLAYGNITVPEDHREVWDFISN